MRFALTLLVIFGAGFLAGYSFFRDESPLQVAPLLARALVEESPVDSHSGAERVAAAIALEKDDPLRAEAELWHAVSTLTADDVSAFSRDFAALARMAKDVGSIGGSAGVAAIRTLIGRWMEHDSAGALSSLNSVVLSDIDATLGRVIMDICAERDPTALLARAVLEKDTLVRGNCAWAVFSRLAKTNPGLGRELLATVPDSLRREAGDAFENGRIEADPFYGLAVAAKLPAGNRDRQLSQVIPLLSRMGTAAVEQAIRQFPELNPVEVGSLLGSLADQNAVAAADLFLSLEPSRLDASAVHSIAWSLAIRDPKAAMEWLDKVPQELVADSRNMVVRKGSARDPRAAMDWFVEHPQSISRRDEEIQNVFDYYLRSDEQAARAWLAKQSPEFSAKLEDKILHVLNETGRAEEAARRISANTGSNTNGVSRTGTLLVRRDPETAAAWAMALRDETVKDYAVTGVVQEWLERDPNAAIAWVSTFPEGELLTSAARDVISQIRNSRPAEAAEWVEKIPDVKKRTDSARMVLEAWQKVDSAAAHAWFSAVPGISEYTRAEVLSR